MPTRPHPRPTSSPSDVQKLLLFLEFPLVAILVAAGMLSSRWLPAAPIGALVFMLMRWLVKGLPCKRTSADYWGLGALLVVLPLTLWVTPSMQTTLPQVMRLLGGMGLYVALIHWVSSPLRLRLLTGAAGAAGLLLALSAFVMVEWPFTKHVLPAGLYEHFRVRVADSVNPNVMAGSLILLAWLPLSVSLFAWRDQHWSERLLAGCAAGGMLAVLVLTQSRSAWLAFAACMVLGVTLRWRRGWLAILLAGGLAVLLIDHFGSGFWLDALLTSGAASGIELRAEIWKRAAMIIRDFPFTGVGMGNFGMVTDLLYPFNSAKLVPHAHNLFLQIAVDLGIPGLMAWLWVLVSSMAAAWRTYRVGKHSGQRWMAGVGAGLLLSQLALVIHGLFDAVTWGMTRLPPLVWFIWGLAIVSANLAREGRDAGQAASGLARAPAA